MSKHAYKDELQLALSRSDAQQMCDLIDAFAAHHEGDWPEEHADAIGDELFSGPYDPDKMLAYVVLAAARTDDAAFIGVLACGPLEDILRDPSPSILDRIIAEARKSSRFRWLLSFPFKVAISERAWSAIAKFRITGPHEEPQNETMPPSYW